MKCWHCGYELIWGGDHSYDIDEGIGESGGIISNFSCSNCPVFVEVYLPIEEDKTTTFSDK